MNYAPYKSMGLFAPTGTPEQLAAFVKRDYVRYGKVIKDIGLTPE